jgi:phosphoribosylformylglycinamidine synthase
VDISPDFIPVIGYADDAIIVCWVLRSVVRRAGVEAIGFFRALEVANRRGKLLAYHDRSDGGLLVTLLEMAFAARAGLDITLDALGPSPLASLFSEELGAVIQLRSSDRAELLELFAQHGLAAGSGGALQRLGVPTRDGQLHFSHQGALIFSETRAELERAWTETSYQIASLRDHPACAQQELERCQEGDPGMQPKVSFECAADGRAASVRLVDAFAERPSVALLREQGVNGQMEMAATFHQAGFRCHDVHMSDLFAGRFDLASVVGLAACGNTNPVVPDLLYSWQPGTSARRRQDRN